MQSEFSGSESKVMGFGEFVAMAAALMATQAIAVDTMLPALPTIGAALHLINENRSQWIVTAYLVGVGCGQLFWGQFSDRYGRRPVLLIGLAVYAVAAVLTGLSSSFTTLLAWRFAHGLAAASVVVSRSVIRDLYSGRHMARVMSLTFIVFLMVPVLAPSLGQLILWLAPWRSIFLIFGVFAVAVFLWVLLRLPETLHPEYRLTLTRDHIVHAATLVLGNRTSLCYTLAMTVMFGSILAYVGMVQQIFEYAFHRAGLMPAMFALCASAMGATAFLNSRIVERVGMRIISHLGLLVFITITGVHVLIAGLGLERLWTFVVLQSATMACLGLTASNFGAMAMEPVGSVAGIGASLQGFISTFGGAVVGALIGRRFNGATLPLAAGAFACGLSSLLFVLLAEQWRLFRPHHAGAPVIEHDSII
ncbi:MAG TPA: multidrug effflux MFS transporter [Steroidobacteraceae bacterium]|nr:multidrug effflux MFS transporter [Steroidobacteraceae bacterium]